MAKILIVDDSSFVRKSLRMTFENAGHEVVGQAVDGEQGLVLYHRLRPEIIILDYVMTGMSGEDVLEKVIQDDPVAKVIMISASGDHTIMERVLNTGAKAFLEKPFARNDILALVDQVMAA